MSSLLPKQKSRGNWETTHSVRVICFMTPSVRGMAKNTVILSTYGTILMGIQIDLSQFIDDTTLTSRYSSIVDINVCIIHVTLRKFIDCNSNCYKMRQYWQITVQISAQLRQLIRVTRYINDVMCESLSNQTNRRTNFPNLFLSRNSTCFGQFICPSSGVFHCTFGTGICHAGLMSFQARPWWNCSSMLVVHESCHHTCVT